MTRSTALDLAQLAAKLAAQSRPPWWRWTSWLAAGVALGRVE